MTTSRWHRNNVAAKTAQARLDNVSPHESPDPVDGEPQCINCDAIEWSLFKRGDSEDDPVFECCCCGYKQSF